MAVIFHRLSLFKLMSWLLTFSRAVIPFVLDHLSLTYQRNNKYQTLLHSFCISPWGIEKNHIGQGLVNRLGIPTFLPCLAEQILIVDPVRSSISLINNPKNTEHLPSRFFVSFYGFRISIFLLLMCGFSWTGVIQSVLITP